MAVAVIAYLSRAAWNSDFGPWGAQPVNVYKVQDDGSYAPYSDGTYDGDTYPYGYELTAAITPGGADPRALASQRPVAAVWSSGDTNLATHKLVFAAFPDIDYTGWLVTAGSDPGLGGVDGLYVSVAKFGYSSYMLPATSVQVIDAFPSFFSHPIVGFNNMLKFAPAPASTGTPPFWTNIIGAEAT